MLYLVNNNLSTISISTPYRAITQNTNTIQEQKTTQVVTPVLKARLHARSTCTGSATYPQLLIPIALLHGLYKNVMACLSIITTNSTLNS